MRGVGAGAKELELEHTDVEPLTDVSGTDASFAQACAAVWTRTRASALLCAAFVCAICVCLCVCSLWPLQYIY